MKTLVTGGCGFIGSHLVELLLNEGHEVLVLDNFAHGSGESLAQCKHQERLTVVKADISQPGEWEKLFLGVDWVVHLAALIDIIESTELPREYFNTNVQGTFNVLEAARAHSIKRFVYVNSGACYGLAESYPTKEDAPKRPQYPYALMKWVGEEFVIHWSLVYGLPAVSIRLFNLYGPRCSALFGRFMQLMQAGKPLTLTGDGSQTRDFTYITDVTSGILAALKSAKVGEVYNIGSGDTVPVRKVAELLGAQINFIPRRPGEMDVTFGDISKAQRDLDWKPKVSIEEGVARMLQLLARGES